MANANNGENLQMHEEQGKRAQIRAAVQVVPAWQIQQEPTVKQVMTPNPTCIRSDVNVLELVRMINRKGFRHLLITDDEGHLEGVISDRDVARCFGPGKYPNEEALSGISSAEIMSTDLITISPEALLETAVALMVDHGISCLPVVDEGCLVGIITNTDLYFVLQSLLQTMRQSRLSQPS